MHPETETRASRALESRPRRLTRRKAIAFGGTVFGSLVAGCLGFQTDNSIPIPEVTVTLDNWSDESHVFHLAIETAIGLGDWHSRTVPGGSEEQLTVSPSEAEAHGPFTLHAVVNDRANSASPVVDPAEEEGVEAVCPRLEIRYDGEQLALNQYMGSMQC